MKSRVPSRTDPTGAPSPFDRQTLTESYGATISDSGTPEATDALQARAPSRCRIRPWRSQKARVSATFSSGSTSPPQWLCVFSSATSRVGAWCGSVPSCTYSSSSSRGSRPSSDRKQRTCKAECTAAPPRS